MKLFFNMCFLPNARRGHPHLGHLWQLLNSIFMCHSLNEINKFYNSPLLKHSISTDWFLLIDNLEHKKTPFEDSYLQLMNWIGLSPIEVVRLNDFKSDLMTGGGESLRTLLKNAATHNIELTQDFWKILFFDFANIRWQVRGSELVKLEPNEKIIKNVFNLRLPIYFYIDMLKDEEEKQIHVSTEKDYSIYDLFDESPFNVIMALFKCMGTPQDCLDNANKMISSHSEYLNARIEKKITWIYRLVCTHTWNEPNDSSLNLIEYPITHLYEKVCIPKNWRDYI